MKGWFTSLSGAIVLSFIALLSFLGGTFLDWRYIIGEEFALPVPGQVALVTLVYMALFGGWFWALLVAAISAGLYWNETRSRSPVVPR